MDKELRVVPGMEPVKFRFTDIVSFSSELSSGVITVRSIYDNVVLDDSGTSEENRKATTGVESQQLLIESGGGLSYVPTTEGERANYTLKIRP